MFKFFVFLFIAVLPASAAALTIDESVALALDSNNQIKAQEEKVSGRQIEQSAAILIYFPSIGVTYGYDHLFDRKKQVNTISAATETVSADGGASTLSVYANLNLFNGFSDISNYNIAKLNYKLNQEQLTTVNYNIILDAQNAFINVLKAKRDLDVANENLKLLQMQRRDSKLAAENGLIAKNDLLQVEVYVAGAELQCITAESNLAIAMRNLEKVINRPIAPSETLTEPDMIAMDTVDIEKLRNTMYANRSDLKSLETSYQISKKNETTSASKMYPTVDVKAGYYFYGQDVSPFSGNPPGSGKDSSLAVGVSATWNVISAASSTLQSIAKKRDTMAVTYNIADTKQSMNLELLTALEKYTMSKAQLVQAKISVDHAKENYRVKKNLYDQNAATMTELLDAATLLNESNVSETQATYGIIAAVYQLERIIESPLIDITE